MPNESVVVKLHRVEHGVASTCAAQLIFARRHAVDRDEKPTAVSYPLGNCMWKLFPDRPLHAGSVTKTISLDKAKGRAGSPLHAVLGNARLARECEPYLG